MLHPIEALADCIMRFEGWEHPSNVYPNGSTSWRNRNPGNLRRSKAVGSGQPTDENGYRIFVNLSDGWSSLLQDIDAKILFGTHGITKQSTLHDFFSIYAPSGDNNDPKIYSKQVAGWLSQIYKVTVMTETTIAEILKLGQTMDSLAKDLPANPSPNTIHP